MAPKKREGNKKVGKKEKVGKTIGGVDRPIVLDDIPEIKEDRLCYGRTRKMVDYCVNKIKDKKSTEQAEDLRKMRKNLHAPLLSDEEKQIIRKCFTEADKWLNSYLSGRQTYTFDGNHFPKLMKNFNTKQLAKTIRKNPKLLK